MHESASQASSPDTAAPGLVGPFKRPTTRDLRDIPWFGDESDPLNLEGRLN